MTGRRENEFITGKLTVSRAMRFVPEQRNAKTALTKQKCGVRCGHFLLNGNKSFRWISYSGFIKQT